MIQGQFDTVNVDLLSAAFQTQQLGEGRLTPVLHRAGCNWMWHKASLPCFTLRSSELPAADPLILHEPPWHIAFLHVHARVVKDID